MSNLITLQSLHSACEEFMSHHKYYYGDAADKTALLQRLSKEGLDALDNFDFPKPSHEFNFMKGCYLLPLSSPLAEVHLERAIKLHSSAPPTYWNRLSECLWIQNKIQPAIDTLLTCPDMKENMEGYCMLSQLVRANGTNNFKESEKYAKKAIELDLTGEEGWYCLGNCLISSFFSQSFDLQVLCRGIKAYKKSAELCPPSAPNPDLHYNLGSVLSYLEDFAVAKVHFEACQAIDDTLGGGKKYREIEEWERKVKDMVGRKGRVKEKNIQKFINQLSQVTVPQGSNGERVHTLSPLSALSVSPETISGNGVTATATNGNYGKAIALRVLIPMGDGATVPARYLVLEKEGGVLVLSIYHQAREFGLTVKDEIVVLNPILKDHGGYKGIQVFDPKGLVVNGRMADIRKFAPAEVVMETFNTRENNE
mmetsp:Transcript_21038/g.43888  ORF Transcript_21038/g.43888 Transcript_21038/m.43888 type:complete len:424 (-) Transcript_21038:37-1308(-)